MRALAVSFTLIVGLASGTRAETGAALHVGIDVIKPALGLPNLEIEVQIDKRITAHVFGEMLAFKTPFTPEGHPEAFARAGLRYFVWDFLDSTRAAGFYGGLGIGAAMPTLADRPSPAVTAEAGYKLVLFEMLQAMPRVYATVPLDGTEPLPGIELLVGAVF